MHRKNGSTSGPRASFPKAILLTELPYCIHTSTSPTQPPSAHFLTGADAPPSNSKEPVPAVPVTVSSPTAASIALQLKTTMIDCDTRLRSLAMVSGDYVPAAQTCYRASNTGPSSLRMYVADVAEVNVVRQIASELGVLSDAFEVVVDSSVRPSTSFILTTGNIAVARADASGEVAVNIALYVLQRTVLDASVELWDLGALDALRATRAERRAGRGADTECKVPGGGTAAHGQAAKGPRTEVRVCVRTEQLAVADAVVRTLRAALPRDCLCISVVLGAAHNLTGPWPSTSGAPTCSKGVSQPADVAATHTVPPASCVINKSSAHGSSVVKGRMTVSAYARVNARLCVVSTGHELGLNPVACLLDPDTPLSLGFFVNPPACLLAPSISVANSSDAYPNARRIEDSDPPQTIPGVLVAAHADVSLFAIDRETTAEEEDLVPVPVCSRTQKLVWLPDALFLGLVPHEVARGPLLFAGCTAPGQLRTVHNVGLCVKRLPIAMSVNPVAVTRMYTYLCVHDGAESSGPPPAQGDSGGPAFRPRSDSSGGCLAGELMGFVCGQCISGGTRGAPLRRYYEFTPAALALAQLREGLVYNGDPTAAAALEFLQPREMMAVLDASASAPVSQSAKAAAA